MHFVIVSKTIMALQKSHEQQATVLRNVQRKVTLLEGLPLVANAKAEAERAKAEAKAMAKADAEARAKADAEARAKVEAEARAKAEDGPLTYIVIFICVCAFSVFLYSFSL